MGGGGNTMKLKKETAGRLLSFLCLESLVFLALAIGLCVGLGYSSIFGMSPAFALFVLTLYLAINIGFAGGIFGEYVVVEGGQHLLDKALDRFALIAPFFLVSIVAIFLLILLSGVADLCNDSA